MADSIHAENTFTAYELASLRSSIEFLKKELTYITRAECELVNSSKERIIVTCENSDADGFVVPHKGKTKSNYHKPLPDPAATKEVTSSCCCFKF